MDLIKDGMSLTLPDYEAVLGAAAIVTAGRKHSKSGHSFKAGTKCVIIEDLGTNTYHEKRVWRLKSIDGRNSYNLFRDEFVVTEKRGPPDYGPRPQFSPGTLARVLPKKYLDFFHSHQEGHIIELQNVTVDPSSHFPFYQVEAIDRETELAHYIPFDEVEILEEQ